MTKKITFLSAGLAIYDVLTTALKGKVSRVYPCAAQENALLPYVEYARTGIYNNPTKSQQQLPYDTCTVEISVYSKTYAESVSLIEDVRAALEGQRIEYSDDKDSTRRLTVDCSKVIDCEETAGTEGFRQSITITCKSY